MTQEYYIVQNKGRKGPYDLVALVRKIRNGSLTGSMQLQQGEGQELKAAQDWPELAEFFSEKKEEKPLASERGSAQQRSLGKALRSGWHFLQRNQYSTVSSGILLLAVIIVSAIVTMAAPPALRPIGYMICFVFAHFLLSCFLLAVLRLARGQPADIAYLETKISPAMQSLLLSSLLISFPSFIGVALLTSELPLIGLLAGLFILIIPGLYMLSIYAFTPLLILDQGYDFWEAMEASRKAVTKNGLEFVGIIYALYVINFLAALCALIPMAITVPVTFGALAEMYDETFS